MAKLTRCSGVLFFALCSMASFALDDPEVDIKAEKLSQQNCIDENTQTCINNHCLTSEETDCQDQCSSLATAKCQQQLDE